MSYIHRISDNYVKVMDRINAAASRVGRNPAGVKLVVVTKGQPVNVVESAIQAGAQIFGENYPEESVDKILAIQNSLIEWHMIGHLQSRKAKLVCAHFHCMQSLDSLQLAQKMERLLAQNNRILPVLLEFNVGPEESKSGWQANDETTWADLLPDIDQILRLDHMKVRGLMTMPPLTVSQSESRVYFRRLAKLRDFLRENFPGDVWDELSMGTSSDYEVAIEEGATFVRIGTSILGSRPLKV